MEHSKSTGNPTEAMETELDGADYDHMDVDTDNDKVNSRAAWSDFESSDFQQFQNDASQKFRSIYANESAYDLYCIGQTGFVVFAMLNPRVSYMLYKLTKISKNVDRLLWKVSPRRKRVDETVLQRAQYLDPFEYYMEPEVGIQQQIAFQVVLADLGYFKDPEIWQHIHQRWCLDILRDSCIEERRQLSAALLSAEIQRDIVHTEGDISTGEREIWQTLEQLKWRESELETFFALSLPALERNIDCFPPYSSVNNQDRTQVASIDKLKSAGNLSSNPTLYLETLKKRIGDPGSGLTWEEEVKKANEATRITQHNILIHSSEMSQYGTSRNTLEGASAELLSTTDIYDRAEIGIEVFSSQVSKWIKTSAMLDTGLEGGNFVSSKFLQQFLKMKYEPLGEGEAGRFNTANGSFVPLGKIELRWLGRNRQDDGTVKKGAKHDTVFLVFEDPTVDIILGWETMQELQAVEIKGLYRTVKETKKRSTAEKAADAAILQQRQAQREALATARINGRQVNHTDAVQTQGSGASSHGTSTNTVDSRI